MKPERKIEIRREGDGWAWKGYWYGVRICSGWTRGGKRQAEAVADRDLREMIAKEEANEKCDPTSEALDEQDRLAELYGNG